MTTTITNCRPKGMKSPRRTGNGRQTRRRVQTNPKQGLCVDREEICSSGSLVDVLWLEEKQRGRNSRKTWESAWKVSLPSMRRINIPRDMEIERELQILLVGQYSFIIEKQTRNTTNYRNGLLRKLNKREGVYHSSSLLSDDSTTTCTRGGRWTTCSSPSSQSSPSE